MGLTVASFFAGIGGFDLGAERAGFTVTQHSEIDKNCVKHLSNKFPDAEQLGSVTDVLRVAADVICGGFPCQDLSVAGKRGGLAGERSGLFYEIARVIASSKPRWLVLENVPGLLSSHGGRDMGIVLDTLAKLGYGVAYRVLDSQYFGVAQRRRRVFIVGSLGSGRSAKVLFEREGLRGNPREEREAGEVAPTLFASGAGTSRTASAGSESEFCIPVAAGCLQELDSRGPDPDTKPGHLLPVLRCLECGEVFTDEFGTGIGTPCPYECPRCGEEERVEIVPDEPVAQVQWASGGGQVENPTAQTLRSGAEHNYQFLRVGYHVRRLTPTECERLQGFPDGWTAGFADAVRYRMLGNAVTVNVAEWLFRRIAAVERGEL